MDVVDKSFVPIDHLFTAPPIKPSVSSQYHDDGFINRHTSLSESELSEEYIEDNRKELVTFFETKLIFNYIGELFKTYLIVECGDNFYFIDKHAAHEKILFDKIEKNYKNSERYSQTLISGIPVTLTPEENDIAWDNKEKIASLGFEFTKFGKNEILLRSIPYVMTQGDTVPTFIELLELISKNQDTELTEFEYKALKMFACKAAIKAGHESSDSELKQLIEEIIKTGNIDYCPHGRPIICEFTKKGLEKAFKRIV
jgi:DNA mismatch repair protein MutL